MKRNFNLKALLNSHDIDALILTHPQDILYITDCVVSQAKLILFSDSIIMLVDGRYIESCRAKTSIQIYNDTQEELQHVLKNQMRIGIDSDHMTVNLFEELKKNLGTSKQYIPLKRPLLRVRAKKELDEIDLLKKSAQLCVQGFNYILSKIHEGITEKQLAKMVECFWLENGADGAAFAPIIASGIHSAYPHHKVTDKIIKRDECILIDLGVRLHNYVSDMTRMVFFGDINPKIKEIANIVHSTKKLVQDSIKVGMNAKELDAIARSYIESQGYGEYFPHSLGHGIGLEVHEAPILRKVSLYGDYTIKPKMAITVEPGIYLPNIGGVRIEDSLLIEENGYQKLTDIPDEPFIIT